MQNTKTNNENLNPEHFPEPSTPTLNSADPSAANITTAANLPPSGRTQNFSFASSYTANRLNSTTNNNNNISSSNKFSSSLPTGSIYFNPITSFSVLHNDDLPFTGKPNAIVRPVRRPDQTPALSRPPLQRENDTDGSMAQTQQQQFRASGAPIAQQSSPPPMQNFVDELNRKLRYLHTREKTPGEAWTTRYSPRNAGHQESHHKRPLFITTVPTGVFLPPAKEPPLPASLSKGGFERGIYAYSSHPVVLNDYNTSPNKNNNSLHSTIPKDKLRRSTAPIAFADKESRLASATATTTNITTSSTKVGYTFANLAGGLHLTKQQFQQQLQQHRAKRETPVEPYKNVMHERRVVRGTNFGAQLLADTDPFDKAAELRRRRALRSKTICRNQRNVLGTPPPVAGRRHEVIQTEKYLEELVQRPPEFSVDTQTDLFLERPPTPPYIPAKVGIDVGTEIADGELFHFDAEAQPIIDILVDACIEQSMLEVAHEQEIAALHKKQEEFLAQREAELAELRRLEAEEIRLQAEKERRLRQDSIARELDAEMQKGVTAAKLLQGHIAGLLPEVLENLEPATDAAKREQLMKTICPWLTAEVAEEVGQIVDSREILTVIIQEIIKQRAEVYAGYKEDQPPEITTPIPQEEGGEGEGEADLECCPCDSEETDPCPPPGNV